MATHGALGFTWKRLVSCHHLANLTPKETVDLIFHAVLTQMVGFLPRRVAKAASVWKGRGSRCLLLNVKPTGITGAKR